MFIVKLNTMKKLVIILVCFPIIGFGQIIKIKPTALLLGDLSIFYETEIVNKHRNTEIWKTNLNNKWELINSI